MARVIAPNNQYTGLSASVMFINGVGETDDPHLLSWFEAKGYTVEHPETDNPSSDVPIDKMTVPQLKEYAAEKKIDLGEATKKEDILKVIQDAQQLNDGKEQQKGSDEPPTDKE
ncbi:hypothetical protein [Paenibacillus fonticola]|uniref:hypothetical protein n=1 Tax=Paenibacillus fonticola TaxID=379896 RepID=UPI0003751BC3|nr:hypothetical protein [Paenibacillus fonticola]